MVMFFTKLQSFLILLRTKAKSGSRKSGGVEKMNKSSTSKTSPGVKFKQNLENKDLKHTEGSDHVYERAEKKKIFSFAGITRSEAVRK